jgi:site-specific DNA recombinase
MLEEEFLAAYRDEEMKRQVFVPGEDHSRELEQTEQSLERLRWESDNGLVDDENLYLSRLSALVARKAQLTVNTVVPARWESVGTGRTYREAWNDLTTDRRQVLRDSRIRLVLHFPSHGSKTQTEVIRYEYRVPDDWPAPRPIELPPQI